MSAEATPSVVPASIPPQFAASFQDLEAKVREARPGEPYDCLSTAFEFAADRHSSQKRKSGEPYLVHPLEVAHLLADMRLDSVCVATGLLHDTVEDTSASVDEIRSLFGEDIARCVDGVTKLGRIDYSSDEARQAGNYRKMLLAMTEDTRVILVKLADRLHNIGTLRHLKPERQQHIARETLEIYAPIALRLGMGKVRSELEDQSFAYLDPEGFKKVTEYIESRRESSEEFLVEVRDRMEARFSEAEIPAKIDGRIKRPYSIFRKLQRQRISLDQVYDLLALRVITDSKKNCYAALGVIHNQWRPVPDRIKDFIAMPRPNLYQSLHTSVITDEGQRFEVQIRTDDMHEMAEQGICSHWKYKEGRVGPDIDDKRVAWLRQLVDWQQDLKDPTDFISTLKVDLYPEEVYVFTPQGKLIVLPREATPVDFAYAIHTEVGDTCIGVKVDGRIVPLRYRLRNGEQVEVITQKSRQPSADWLSFVKTSRARHKIKQSLNARRRLKAEEIGQKALEKEARRLKVTLSKVDPELLLKVARENGCSQLPDLHAALGYGKFSARQIVSKLTPKIDADPEPIAAPPAPSSKDASSAPVVVSGFDDVLVYRGRCCNAIYGEPSIGYITRGKGVAVHARSCPNVQNLMYEAERRIDVAWAADGEAKFKTRLSIYVDDQPNILNQITNVLTEEQINISRLESRGTQGTDNGALVRLTVEVAGVNQLDRIIARIRTFPFVREVNRPQGE